MIKNAIPKEYVVQKFSSKTLVKKKGTKNNNDIGMPIKILFAKIKVFSSSLCSKYEKIKAMILINGKAIIKPASWGFLKDNQLANDKIILDNIIFKRKRNILGY